jgi:hypothetical protein
MDAMRYNVAMRSCLLVVVVAFTLGACGRSGGADGAMGTGGSCEEHLAEVVDESYLVDQGVEVVDLQVVSDEIAEAIETICANGPASTTIADGVERVVTLVRARTTSH